MKKGLGYEGLGLKVAKDAYLSSELYFLLFPSSAEGGEQCD